MQGGVIEKYAHTLSRMIAFKTLSSSAQGDKTVFYNFRELLKECFPKIFEVCELEDFDGSFLLRWKGSSSDAPIMLMNHQDVVDAQGEWKYPAFSGVVAEGRLWGRGTLDTKGGLFAMLCAANELAEEGYSPVRDVYFVSSCTEETDGSGADTISKELFARGIRFACVLDEGGMMIREPIGGAKGIFAMVGVGEKGCIDLKFSASSSGGHASTPGKNTPLVRLGRFMDAAERKKMFKSSFSDTTHAMFSEISSSMKGPLGFVLAHSRLFAPFLVRLIPAVSDTAGAMLRTTLAFTMAQGSEASNVLPHNAYVIGNMRFSHHQGRDASVKAVERLAKKYGVKTEAIDGGFESPISDHKSEYFALIKRTVDKLYPGVKTAPYIMTGASDSRYMSRICDNCFRFSPFVIDDEQLGSIHGINENVSIDSLAPAVEFYKCFIIGAQNEG